VFIIKFNKMIHNKWLWGAFASIVVFAFAFSDLFHDRSGERGESRSGIGVLDNEDVTPAEFELARMMIQIESDKADFAQGDHENEIWERLAAIRLARKLGLRVTDQELLTAIHNNPSFQDANGNFQHQTYRYIVEEVLRLNREYFETVMRNQILVSKLESAILAAAWPVPSVAAEQARGMTDIFTVQVGTISNKFAAAEMPVAEEDLENFLRERIELYRVPDRVAVRYVEFPVSNYRDQVAVVEDELRDYYDANLPKFQINTNNVEETLPFEDARGIAESELKSAGAREMAGEAAADFADIFYLRAESLAEDDFERLAAEQSLAVKTTGLFSATAQPFQIDRSAAFAEAAFDLDSEMPRDRYSDAIVGKNAAYVMALHRQVASYDPPLEEIRAKVVEDYLQFVRTRAFIEHVDQIRGTITTEMAKDRPFAEVVAELEVTLGTNLTVTAIQAYSELPGGTDLAQSMTRMDAGQVTPAAIDNDGAAFLYVVARQPGEEIQRRILSGQLISQLRGNLSRVLRDDWRKDNLERMRPVTSREPEIDRDDEAND